MKNQKGQSRSQITIAVAIMTLLTTSIVLASDNETDTFNLTTYPSFNVTDYPNSSNTTTNTTFSSFENPLGHNVSIESETKPSMESENKLKVQEVLESQTFQSPSTPFIYSMSDQPSACVNLTPPTILWNWTATNSTTDYNSTTVRVNLSEIANCTLHFNGTHYPNQTSETSITWNITNIPNGNYSTINVTCEDPSGNKANSTNVWWDVAYIPPQACKNLNITGQYYRMIGDITDRGPTCFNATADNITLDCKGHIIDGNKTHNWATAINATRVLNFTLVNCSITDWRYGVKLKYSNSSFLKNLSMTSTYSLDDVYAIYLEESRSNSIENNIIEWNATGGFQSYGLYIYIETAMTADNNEIIDNFLDINSLSSDAYGIYMYNGATSLYNTISNNTFDIDGSFAFGMSIENDGIFDYSTISNNTFDISSSSCSYGIYLENAATSMDSNTISGNTITVTSSYSGSEFSCYGIFIYDMDSTDISLNKINISAPNAYEIGLYLDLADNNNIWNNTLRTGSNSEDYGVYFESTPSKNNTFTNTTIFGGSVYISAAASTNNTFLNCTYDSETVGVGAKLIRIWYVDIYANYSNGATAEGANIHIYNYKLDLMDSRITDSTGHTNLELIQYKNLGGTKYYYSNYTISATDGTYTGQTEVNVTTNMRPNITLVTLAITDVVTVDITNGSTTIIWNTNTLANSTVEYGLTTDYGSAATGSSHVTNHSVILTGLTEDTKYYYKVNSTTLSGHSTSSAGYWFITADVEYANMTSNETLSLNFTNHQVELELLVGANTTGTINVSASSTHEESASFGVLGLDEYIKIEASSNISGNLTWALIKIYYTQAEITTAGIEESSLRIYYWNGTDWDPYNSPVGGVETVNNYVWANSTHFSAFAIGGSAVGGRGGGERGGDNRVSRVAGFVWTPVTASELPVPSPEQPPAPSPGQLLEQPHTQPPSAPEALFDVLLSLVTEEIQVGEDLVFTATFMNFGTNVTDINIEYYITDASGRERHRESESRTVEVEETVSKTFNLLTLEEGTYTLNVKITYGDNQMAIASEEFTVVSKPVPIQYYVFWISIIVAFVVVIVAVITRRSKQKEKRKTKNEK